VGLVADAVALELKELNAEGSALGATAVVLAEAIDDSGNSLTSRSMAAKELRETLGKVRMLVSLGVCRTSWMIWLSVGSGGWRLDDRSVGDAEDLDDAGSSSRRRGRRRSSCSR
jgi:hypothetical protein